MKKHCGPYHDLIAGATNAPKEDLAKIEAIMRNEVLRSTLDWQTADQLTEAAIEAYTLLKSDREFYEVYFSNLKIVYADLQAPPP